MTFIERAADAIATVLFEVCTVEECENTLAPINPADWQRAAQAVLDVANYQGAIEALTEFLAVYDRVYQKGGRRLPGPGMYVASEKARKALAAAGGRS